jgi:tetratricopeptide (TPR) repeat protein
LINSIARSNSLSAVAQSQWCIIMADLGQVHYFAHEYDQAIDYCNRALTLDPNFQIAHEYLFDIYYMKGMEHQALTHLAHRNAGSPATELRLRESYFKAGLQVTLGKSIGRI